jgi:hypothetical protein
VICTGVNGLPWGRHGDEAPARPRLDRALLLETMGAGFHRAKGDAQRLGDLGRRRSRLPELDEFGLPGSHRLSLFLRGWAVNALPELHNLFMGGSSGAVG